MVALALTAALLPPTSCTAEGFSRGKEQTIGILPINPRSLAEVLPP